MKRPKRLLVMGFASHYGQGIIRGVHSYCHAHGHWQYRLEGDTSPEGVRRALLAIHRWKADAIVACVQTKPVERLLLNATLPVVNVTGGRQLKFPSIVTDCPLLGRRAAEHFLDNGFRNFAFCARTSEISFNQICDGFTTRLAQHGFTCNVFDDRDQGNSESDWLKINIGVRRWIQTLKKPVAIMCIYDFRAQEIALACEDLGLRVPDDVAIVGTENQETLCLMCTPPLSSFELDSHRIGYEAARLVDRMLRAHKPPPTPILIPPRRLVIRQSSDIVALDDPDIADALRFIRRHSHEPISVKELLQQVPVSRRFLEKHFVKLIGRTPKAEIMRVRMDRARTFLAETSMPIPAIAQRSGFNDRHIFSKSFRREMQMTPNTYRRRCWAASRLPHNPPVPTDQPAAKLPHLPFRHAPPNKS